MELHSRGPLAHQQFYRLDTTDEGSSRDQTLLDAAAGLTTPPQAVLQFPPFKFEARRMRIDWRLLHGVDVNQLIRDVDLDSLERLVSCVTWGDLDAEQPAALHPGSTAKLFRLAQLLLEYLLYVQDNLQQANTLLDSSRAKCLQHVQLLNSRCREQHSQLKECRKELRRARKTIKTYDLMAAATAATAAAAATTTAAQQASTNTNSSGSATAAAAAAAVESHHNEQRQHGLFASGLGQPGGTLTMTAGELLLQGQLSELSERLALAGCEVGRLQQEREELQYTIRHVHDSLAAKTGAPTSARRHFSPGRWQRRPGAASPLSASAAGAAAVAAPEDGFEGGGLGSLTMQQQQELQVQVDEAVQRLRQENASLRQQLAASQEQEAAAAADASLLESLRQQLNDKTMEAVRLHGELRQKEASVAAFQAASDSLRQQLEQLQRQLASPEATTPSFVSKQRQQLEAAQAATARAEGRTSLLLDSNAGLKQQLQELRRQLGPEAAATRDDREDDAVAAAELALQQGPGAAAGSSLERDWKLLELERLQQENRLLQDKVASLQHQLHDLEQTNHHLGRQLAAAAAAAIGGGTGAASPARDAPAAAAGSAAFGSRCGWVSVDSSGGPKEELTLGEFGPPAQGAAGGSAAAGASERTLVAAGQSLMGAAGRSSDRQQKQLGGAEASGQDSGNDEQDGRRSIAVKPAAAAVTVLPAGAAPAAASQPRPQQLQEQQQPPAVAAAAPAGKPAAAAGGSISVEEANQLKQRVALLAAGTQEQLDTQHKEARDDWQVPFNLEPHEKDQFRQLMPHELSGRPGLLMAQPHTLEEVLPQRPAQLAAINRRIDAGIASFGIHPGRTGLSKLELVAAMQMLTERRSAWSAALPPEQQERVEVARLALLLHPYNTLQEVLAQQPADALDGKQRLPGAVEPLLVSAVRPPALMLPAAGPPVVRTAVPAAAAAGGSRSNGVLASSTGSSNRYHSAAAEPDSEDESPVQGRRPAAAASAMHSSQSRQAPPGSPATGRAVFSSAPLAASPGAAAAQPSHNSAPFSAAVAAEALPTSAAAGGRAAGGSFSPMSAALHAKQQSVQSSLQLAASGAGAPTAATAATAARSGGGGSAVASRGVVPAAAAAMKQYLATSFDDSDEL